MYTKFREKGLKNPTYSWITKLKEETNFKLSLIMGFDSFISLPNWTQASLLLNALDCVYIASRGESDDLFISAKESLNANYNHLKIITLGHHKYEELSSTKIRENK